MTTQVTLELGHRANFRKKVTPEGFTHDWTVFVRGREGCNIQHFVEKVVFNLHESFPKPKRVVKEPPYQVSEAGYAGFELPIDIYFKNKEEPKKIRFKYDLFLHVANCPPVNNVRCEKLTFQNPTEEFRKKLLRAGGREIGNLEEGEEGAEEEEEEDTGAENPIIDAVPTSTTQSSPSVDGDAAQPPPKKPTPPSPMTVPSMPPVDPVFSDLFGAPLKAEKIVIKTDKKHKSSSKERAPSKPKSSHGSPPAGSQGKDEKSKESKEKSKETKALKRPADSTSSSESSKKKKRSSDSSKHERSKSSKDKNKESKSWKKHEREKTEIKPDKIEFEPRPETKKTASGKPIAEVKPKAQNPMPSFDDLPIKPKGDAGVYKDELSPGDSMDGSYDDPKKSVVVDNSPASSVSFSPSHTGSGGTLGTLMAEMDEAEEEEDILSPLPSTTTPPTFHHGQEEKRENHTSLKSDSLSPGYKSKHKKSSSSSSLKLEKKSNRSVEKKSKDFKKVGHDTEGTEKHDNKTPSCDEQHCDLNGHKAPNGEHLSVLLELQKKLLMMQDRKLLQQVVNVIEETGRYKIGDSTFDFDLCMLDSTTVEKIKVCLDSAS